jgi:hypothetical protein
LNRVFFRHQYADTRQKRSGDSAESRGVNQSK